mmetsp:Transcript_10366/g.23694  ORF Transcript_10366/g.23694 Transcript_10366/m.23694 type:complete len:241 (-) Transcript_10366:1435-2157(-)
MALAHRESVNKASLNSSESSSRQLCTVTFLDEDTLLAGREFGALRAPRRQAGGPSLPPDVVGRHHELVTEPALPQELRVGSLVLLRQAPASMQRCRLVHVVYGQAQVLLAAFGAPVSPKYCLSCRIPHMTVRALPRHLVLHLLELLRQTTSPARSSDLLQRVKSLHLISAPCPWHHTNSLDDVVEAFSRLLAAQLNICFTLQPDFFQPTGNVLVCDATRFVQWHSDESPSDISCFFLHYS